MNDDLTISSLIANAIFLTVAITALFFIEYHGPEYWALWPHEESPYFKYVVRNILIISAYVAAASGVRYIFRFTLAPVQSYLLKTIAQKDTWKAIEQITQLIQLLVGIFVLFVVEVILFSMLHGQNSGLEVVIYYFRPWLDGFAFELIVASFRSRLRSKKRLTRSSVKNLMQRS